MADLAISGYTVVDLDWLRDAVGVAHLELDPWGSLIVSPATDEHEIAQSELVAQAVLQLRAAGYRVVPSMPWAVPGGTGYLMIADLTVLPADWRRVGELGLDPPPLLVVEIASPSTRRADRGRKLADYRLGSAGLYLLVDLPAMFEAHDFVSGKIVRATGEIDLVVGGRPVHFELPTEDRDRAGAGMSKVFLPAPIGYTVDDLDWLRDAIGVAHLELDPWGSLIVSPADDQHEHAAMRLARQAIEQLSHPVSVNGFGWIVPAGTGYLMVPDLLVLAPGSHRASELHFDPPPLLVVEIASRSTRRADRTRKMADYRLGGAAQYLLVDLPSSFELHDFAAGTVVTAEGSIDLVVGGEPVRFSLPA